MFIDYLLPPTLVPTPAMVVLQETVGNSLHKKNTTYIQTMHDNIKLMPRLVGTGKVKTKTHLFSDFTDF